MEFQTAENMMFKSCVFEETDLADFTVIMKVVATSIGNAVILLRNVHHVGVIVTYTDTAITVRIPGANANLLWGPTSWPRKKIRKIWSTAAKS